MKILHTGDWHLGKIVHGIHMTEDQKYVIDQIIQCVEKEQPDVVIIAGDLYDRSVPPKDAVELLNDALTAICVQQNTPVLAISGNHDSADRLGFGASLFRGQQLYIHTEIGQALTPITLEDGAGAIDFYAVPYTEPEEVAAFFEDDHIDTHHKAMERMVQEIEATMNTNHRNIFIGHTFLRGGEETESEERLTVIGGTPYVEAELLDSFDYVALGHLHQAQKITSPHLRYSGSILKYSFSEANHQKSITLLEIDEHQKVECEKIPLHPRRDMRIVEGYFNDFIEERVIRKTEDYLHIQLLDDGQINDPVSRLRELFPNILRLERKNFFTQQSLTDIQQMKERQTMTHEELFAAFYKEIKGEEMPKERERYVYKWIQSLMKEERNH
ncbi:exonuclease SbcCD subunit D [Gracilibacillus halophilus]|nr:exonuclease SbcCD subunit D [Gracilibacillus halophilus]